MPRSNSFSLGVWIGVGGRYEPSEYSGISHFLEHMVFKGTHRRSYREIKESIEGVGGELNAFTSDELTCFFSKVLVKHKKTALDVLVDLVADPKLTAADIKKERMIIYEEIKMYNDLPHHLVYDQLMHMLWPEHPLGRNIAGDVKTLKGITAKELLRFKQKYYAPRNVLISACGALAHDEIVEMAEKIIGDADWKFSAGDNTTFLPAPPKSDSSAVKLLKKDTQQAHLCLGWPSLDRSNPRRYALALLHVLLGANMSSRLFNSLRENNGFAYEVGTGLKSLADCGVFYVHAGLVEKKILPALRIILKELKDIANKPVCQGEFTRAKEYYRGQMLLGLEDSMQHMLWMGERAMTQGKIETVAHVLELVDSLRCSDITRIAAELFFGNKAQVSLVGNVDTPSLDAINELVKKRY